MEAIMKAFGKIIHQMGKVEKFCLMEHFVKEILKMDYLMDM